MGAISGNVYRSIALPVLPIHTQDLIMARADDNYKEFEMFLMPLTDEEKAAEMEKINNLWNGPNFNDE